MSLPEPGEYLRDPDAIYRESRRIIESEADLSRLDEGARSLAVRLIHACGMTDLVSDLTLSRGAVDKGRQALEAGAVILCDVEMVARGVIASRLPAGNAVVCRLNDPAVPDLAKTHATTRSAAAVDLWDEHLDNAVVAIGNAPTALFRLLEKVDDGEARPALVIGMPVGFVGAAESKEALAGSGLPFITVHGAARRQRARRRRRQRADGRHPMKPWLRIVGIGEDGLAGLAAPARALVDDAEVLVGGERHLAMVADHTAEKLTWESPLKATVARLESLRGKPVTVLASGDPMAYGIGVTLMRRFAHDEIVCLPGIGAFSLACARLGWAAGGMPALDCAWPPSRPRACPSDTRQPAVDPVRRRHDTGGAREPAGQVRFRAEPHDRAVTYGW